MFAGAIFKATKEGLVEVEGVAVKGWGTGVALQGQESLGRVHITNVLNLKVFT